MRREKTGLFDVALFCGFFIVNGKEFDVVFADFADVLRNETLFDQLVHRVSDGIFFEVEFGGDGGNGLEVDGSCVFILFLKRADAFNDKGADFFSSDGLGIDGFDLMEFARSNLQLFGESVFHAVDDDVFPADVFQKERHGRKVAVAGKNDVSVNAVVFVSGLIDAVEHNKVGKILFGSAASASGFNDVVGKTAQTEHFAF